MTEYNEPNSLPTPIELGNFTGSLYIHALFFTHRRASQLIAGQISPAPAPMPVPYDLVADQFQAFIRDTHGEVAWVIYGLLNRMLANLKANFDHVRHFESPNPTIRCGEPNCFHCLLCDPGPDGIHRPPSPTGALPNLLSPPVG